MYSFKNIRTSLVLTTSYVAGNVIGDDRTAGDQTSNNFKNNQAVLFFDFTKGSLTSAQFKVEYAYQLAFDLAYDGQSGNFTAGLVITGAKTGATAMILEDSDAGATGALTIQSLNGINFDDNELITDTSTGSATVNGALNFLTATPSDNTFFQETSSLISSGADTITAIEHTIPTPTTRGRSFFLLNFKTPYARISLKGTGTTTNSLLAVKALISVV